MLPSQPHTSDVPPGRAGTLRGGDGGETDRREVVGRLADALASLRREGATAGPGLLGLIGGSPLVALTHLDNTVPRAEILVKLEALNPGGSLKDRTALGMILDAEARGHLRPGVSLVEATAGNTGIGLALVAGLRGYALTLVIPARYSGEKPRICEALGARVLRVEGDCAGMRECIEVARSLEGAGVIFLNQFENAANPCIHELTTGPEIAAQCSGPIDALVMGVGTGGTISGVGRFLRQLHPELEIVAVEAQGSVIGGGPPGRTRIEGIGNSFMPQTLDRSILSSIVTVADDDAFATARRLAASERILAGPSGGAIVFAALAVARRLGPGRRVITFIPDAADRYWSKDLFPRA